MLLLLIIIGGLFMKITGQRIRELRLEKGMTQEELGARIGVQGSAIGKYERGLLNLKDFMIKDIAKVFGVSPVYIIGLTDCRTMEGVRPNATINEITEYLQALSSDNQTIVLNIVKAMAGGKK